MGRTFAGVIAGIATWIVIATVLNLGMRFGWPAYALVEKTYVWTLGIQAARLTVGALSSMGAGYVATRIAPSSRAALWSGIVVLLLALPAHFINFVRMPLWYHAFFLLTLVPFVLLGQRFARLRS